MPDFPLQADSRAELISGSLDFNAYQSKVPQLYLKHQVPTAVREHIEVAQKILNHSYFVYEFIDVAFTQVVIGLEKALRLRFKEIEQKDAKINLDKLSKWASSKYLFEYTDMNPIDDYRKVRNGKVHDPKNTLGGILYMQRILEPIGFINDLYEDIELRKKRNELWINLLKDVQEIYSQGATLAIGDETILVRNIVPVFINNKHQSSTYYFSMVVLTDPSQYSSRNMFLAENFVVRDVIFNKNEKTISGFLVDDGRPFLITSLNDAGLAAFKWWTLQIEEILKKEDGDNAIPVELLFPLSVQTKADQLRISSLFDFYRV